MGLSVSPEEYVELERKLGRKHEYCAGRMVEMPGASATHAQLQVHLTCCLDQREAGGRFSVYSSDFRIVIEVGNMATYPDLSIVCGPVRASQRYRHSCTNPTVLFEVLSPETERYDRGAKFEQYRKLESLREYVLVSQHAASVDLFRLENGHWVLYEVRGQEAVLELTSIGIEVPMADLYYNVRFEDAETD